MVLSEQVFTTIIATTTLRLLDSGSSITAWVLWVCTYLHLVEHSRLCNSCFLFAVGVHINNCCLQAPADGQITPESALAQQITKGQAREIMQKYMPVPEATVRSHCSILVNVGSKHKQMLMQVSLQTASILTILPVCMLATKQNTASAAQGVIACLWLCAA